MGVAPRTHERKLHVVPHFPTDWEEMALRDIQVGDAQFTLHVTHSPRHYTLTVTTDSPEYQLELGFYLPAAVTVTQVTCNGQPIPWDWAQTNAGRTLLCAARGDAQLDVQIHR